jgi:DNA-binding transcriptional LysR family regulator
MQPTARATAMIGTAREALACLQRLSARPSDFVPAIAQRHFCVAMTDASHITLLPQLFAHVRAVAPLIRLEAAQICPDTARALQSGEIDLALGLIPELTAGFYEQTLFEQDWVCLANPRHPRLRKSLTVRAYKEEAHVGIVHGTGYRLLEMALARQGVERHILLELPAFLGLSAIISTTDLLATLPRQIGETLARTAGLNVFPCPLSIPSFSVKQHWHTRYHHDAANRWLRAVCVRLFAMKKPRSTRNG